MTIHGEENHTMKTHHGSCHCGAIEFEVRLDGEITEARHCDCSLCKRKSAFVASAVLENLRITKGEDKLSLYTWNTGTAKHYFCSICGIYTHHQRRSNPNEYGFNIACIEGINPFDFAPAKIHDGVNHPSDP